MSDNDDADGERTGASIDEAVEPEGGGEKIGDDPARDSFSPWDEVHEAFGDARALEVVIEEGMPTVRVPEGNDAHAPALTHENFTCIENVSGFVIRGPWREVAAEFKPEEVERAKDGRFRVPASVVLERLQMPLTRAKKEYEQRNKDGPDITLKDVLISLLQSWRIQNALGSSGGQGMDRAVAMQQVLVAQMGSQMPADPDWVEVEPVRPACRNLVQQVVPLTEQEKALGYTKGWLKRYCSVRRTVAGAFMELTDHAIRACNVRDPLDVPGLELMTDFDLVQLGRSKERVLLPLFQATANKNPASPPAPEN